MQTSANGAIKLYGNDNPAAANINQNKKALQ